MARVLVTGGSGFIGTNLVEYFNARGDVVLNLDRSPPRQARHAPLWRAIDILDARAVDIAVREFQPEYIVHMAARTDLAGRDPGEYRVNTDGVAHMIDAASGLKTLKRIVFASSMLVCRVGYQPVSATDYCPTTAYGASKVAAEKLIVERAADRLPWVIVRPTSIWGPWFDVPYRDFFTAVRRGLYFHPRRKRIRRSYGFVGNAVFQIDKLLVCEELSLQGKTFYLADYEPLELKDWATAIQRAFSAPRVREVPLFMLACGAKSGDALVALGYGRAPLTSFRLNNLLTDAVFDMTQLRNVCGSIPYSVEEGVVRTVSWMNAALK